MSKPKLEAILNPKSKHYDDTPDKTKQLSLVFYVHQHKHKRFGHKRITPDDRQWVMLVQIKNEILRHIEDDPSRFLPVATQLFASAERMSQRMGRRNLYLTLVLSRVEQHLDEALASLDEVLTKKERKVFRIYKSLRTEATDNPYEKKLEAGTLEHNLIRQVISLSKKYKLTSRIFLKIHFEAFKLFGSFPRLKDLVSDKAIDRVELYLSKQRKLKVEEENDPTDKAYWDKIRTNSSK